MLEEVRITGLGVIDDAVFEPVTTELEVVAQPRRQAPPRPRPRKRTRQGS